MAVNLQGWIRSQWDATKGNLWWTLLYAAFTSLGGGGVVAGAAKFLLSLVHAPPTNTLGDFVVGALASLSIAICFFAAWRKTHVGGVTTTSMETVSEQAVTVKEVDIFTEILQVHFRGNYPYTYTVFMKLKLTNRGPADATIGSWMLFALVGEEETRCEVLGDLPANIAIKRVTYPDGVFQPVDTFEQMQPNLGEQIDRYPLKRGIPQVGWVCFNVPAYDFEPAVNATLTVLMMDSLGGVHRFVREAKNHKRDGEITERAPASLPLVRSLLGSG